MDLHQPDRTDLADALVWQQVEMQLRGSTFQAILASPPCNSFSGALTNDGDGPRPMRDGTDRGIFGLPDLAAEEKTKVQTGTLLALRGAVAVHLAASSNTPWIAEPPLIRPEKPSVFVIPEWIQVRSRAFTSGGDLDQFGYADLPRRPITRT